MRKILTYLSVGLLFAVGSCEKDGEKLCTDERETASIIGDFPDSLKVGESYPLEVKYILESSCGEFDRFDIKVSEKSFIVKMITKYSGCNCNLEFKEQKTTYNIDVDYPGYYEFRFWQADTDWEVRTLKIYE